MKTPFAPQFRRPLRAAATALVRLPARAATTARVRLPVLALFLTLAIAALAPVAAEATVTPAEATAAADRGAAWFESGQEETGALASDWAMTALAATGTNAADVRAGLADPSAQDYYLDEWQAEGPGDAGSPTAAGAGTPRRGRAPTPT